MSLIISIISQKSELSKKCMQNYSVISTSLRSLAMTGSSLFHLRPMLHLQSSVTLGTIEYSAMCVSLKKFHNGSFPAHVIDHVLTRWIACDYRSFLHDLGVPGAPDAGNPYLHRNLAQLLLASTLSMLCIFIFSIFFFLFFRSRSRARFIQDEIETSKREHVRVLRLLIFLPS